MNCSPSIAAIPIERFRLGALGRGAAPTPQGLPCDIENVPTYSPPGSLPQYAQNQLDNAFAWRGFHKSVKVGALNSVEEWGERSLPPAHRSC